MKKYIWVATLCLPGNSLLKNKTLKDSFHWIQDDFCSHNIDKVDIPCLCFEDWSKVLDYFNNYICQTNSLLSKSRTMKNEKAEILEDISFNEDGKCYSYSLKFNRFLSVAGIYFVSIKYQPYFF